MQRILAVVGALAGVASLVVAGGPAAASSPGPTPPRHVEAVPGQGAVTLTWSAPAAGSVSAYRIYRDGRRVAAVTDLSAAVHTDTGLNDGDRHRYEVSAMTEAGESARSDPVVVTVGPRPEDPRPRGGTESGGTELAPQSRTYTYSLSTRGRIRANTQYFALHVNQTLNDPRGWSLGGAIEFRQVDRGGAFTVYLAEAATVPSFGSPCSSAWSCRVGRSVIINQTRWQQATDSWRGGGGSLDGYRHYVVNHEVGHWMGFGHAGCPGGGQPAPVMQQQSKGLNGCRHNTWPVSGERSSAAGRHGVRARRVGPPVKRATFGQPGDKVLSCDWNGDGVETPGVVRGNQWRLRNNLNSGGPTKVFFYGNPGDRPVCGDWDGNGTETAGVVRGNRWLLRNSNTPGAPVRVFRFGAPGQRPVVGDWNGDGVDTPGMVDGNIWRVRNRNSTGPPFATFTFGHRNDIPVAGDWDGNGRTDPGMVRGSRWRFRRSLTSGTPQQMIRYGQAVPPVAGRWVGLANDLPGRSANGRWSFRRYAPIP